VGQEFFINSRTLEAKVRELLPSQGGAEAGFDLSASTQIIPVINLTESAEGSNLRQDLQSALSHDTATEFSVAGGSFSPISGTGYFRIIGTATSLMEDSNTDNNGFQISDGATSKYIWRFVQKKKNSDAITFLSYDFIFLLQATDTFTVISADDYTFLAGSIRQVASLDGTLTNP
jgi:hypothetical protein